MELSFMVGTLNKNFHNDHCLGYHCPICSRCFVSMADGRPHPELPGYYCNERCMTMAPVYWKRVLHEWEVAQN